MVDLHREKDYGPFTKSRGHGHADLKWERERKARSSIFPSLINEKTVVLIPRRCIRTPYYY